MQRVQFIYTCAQCSGPARSNRQSDKPATNNRNGKLEQPKRDQMTLGSWECAKCGKGIKVRRERVTPKKEAA